MRNTKRLFSMLLAIAMMFSLAISVMADDHTEHVITIKKAVKGHEYEAYMIFDGTVEISGSSDPVLVDIKWGSGIEWDDTVDFTSAGVNDVNLIEALQSSDINPAYYSYYTGIPTSAANEDEENAIARSVAVALSNNNNAEHGLAFAAIAGKYLSATATGTSAPVPNAENPTHYVINNLADGYYLIKDVNNSTIGETGTLYVMSLVKNVEITPKDGTVSITHSVLETNGNPYNVRDFYIGDIVKFEVTGTVPSRFNHYTEGFAMDFIIDLQDKFTFDNLDRSLYPVTVNVLGGGQEKLLTENTHYTVQHTINTVPGHEKNQLVVSIPDLNNVGTTVMTDYVIEVRYAAKLNNYAVIGNGEGPDYGNTVSAHIEFTSNPYSFGGEKAKTVEEKASVFTYQLELFKKNGTMAGDVGLEGAKFKLYRGDGATIRYAFSTETPVLVDINNTPGITEDDPLVCLVNGWGAEGDDTVGTEVTSPASGIIIFEGLDDAIYHLVETDAPNAFNKIEDPIRLNIKATLDNANIDLDAITITPAGSEIKDGTVEDGKVSIIVVNNPGNTLPSTGGIGTTIFYVAGSILVVGAAVLLITRKRMEQ